MTTAVGTVKPEAIKQTLILTLERPQKRQFAIIAYPYSYEIALSSARIAFDLPEGETIVLRRAVKRPEGTQFHWANIISDEWPSVVRPSVDEIGVFLESDKEFWNEMTYSRTNVGSGSGPHATGGTQTPLLDFIVERQQYAKVHGTRYVIPVPQSYEACQNDIKNTLTFFFPNGLLIPNKPLPFRIRGRFGHGSDNDGILALLTPKSYEVFIQEYKRNPIIVVSWDH